MSFSDQQRVFSSILLIADMKKVVRFDGVFFFLFSCFSLVKKVDEKASGYEYLDHTADVQLHSWAPSLKEALELICVAMFGYITELDKVEEDDSFDVTVEASGHDMDSLLYSLMDEFLFQVRATKKVCLFNVLG